MPVVVGQLSVKNSMPLSLRKLLQRKKGCTSKVWTKKNLWQEAKVLFSELCGLSQANGQGIPPVFPALAGNQIASTIVPNTSRY